MSENDNNFLGAYRDLIAILITLICSYVFFRSQWFGNDAVAGVIRLFIFASIVYLIVKWLTEDEQMRMLMASLYGVMVGVPSGFIVGYAFNGLFGFIAGLLVFFIALADKHEKLEKSEAFGEVCEFCGVRGRLVREVLERSFDGKRYNKTKETKYSTDGRVSGHVYHTDVYNTYREKIKQKCEACKKEKEYTSYTKDYAGRA